MDENKNVEKTKFGVRTTHPVTGPYYSAEAQWWKDTLIWQQYSA